MNNHAKIKVCINFKLSLKYDEIINQSYKHINLFSNLQKVNTDSET